jgi:hypothetical protein
MPGEVTEMTQPQSEQPVQEPAVAEQSWTGTFFGVVARPQTWLNLVYLLLSFPLGLAYFILLVVGLSVGISLTIVVVGIPILLGLILLWRQIANLERLQARALLGLDIRSSRLPWDGRQGFWAKIGALLSDRTTWLDLIFLIVKFPLGVISFVLVVTGLAASAGFVVAPILEHYGLIEINGADVHIWPYSLLLVPVGVLALFVSLHVLNAWTWMNARMAEALLAVPEPSQRMETEAPAPQGWPAAPAGQGWPQPQVTPGPVPQGWPQAPAPQGWPQAPAPGPYGQGWPQQQTPQGPAPQGWPPAPAPGPYGQGWPQQQTPQGWPQQQTPQGWPQPQPPQGWPQPPQGWQGLQPPGWPAPQDAQPQGPQQPQAWPQSQPPAQRPPEAAPAPVDQSQTQVPTEQPAPAQPEPPDAEGGAGEESSEHTE